MVLVNVTTAILIGICLILELTKEKCTNTTGPLYKDNDIYKKSFIVLFALVLIFVEGFRFEYQDTGVYKGVFSTDITTNLFYNFSNTKEYGFVFFEWLIKIINDNSQFFILVISIFITVSDVYFIEKYAFDLPFSLVLYFFLSFISNINGIRQICAAVIMMLAFPYLVEKKYVRYFLFILLASTFHRSILVVIPLTFLITKKCWNNWLIFFVAFCAFSVVVPGPMNFIIGIFVTEDYSHYTTAYTATANFLHVLIDGVPLVLGIIYNNQHKDDPQRDRTIDLFINMQAIKFSFMLLALNMAQYARIGMYMRNSTAIIAPFLIAKVFDKKENRMVQLIAIILYFIVFFVENNILNGKGYFDLLYLNFDIF